MDTYVHTPAKPANIKLVEVRRQSTKTYGHDIGISCAFRQWRAKSHCSKLHGYALSFKFTFESTSLDENNWVVDFGSLKPLKAQLEAAFDHKTIVAADDPQIKWFQEAAALGILDVTYMDSTGCEKFAEFAYQLGQNFLNANSLSDRVKLLSVEVCEHGANSALYLSTEVR